LSAFDAYRLAGFQAYRLIGFLTYRLAGFDALQTDFRLTKKNQFVNLQENQ